MLLRLLFAAALASKTIQVPNNTGTNLLSYGVLIENVEYYTCFRLYV